MPILEGKGVITYFGVLAPVSNVDCNVEQGEILSSNGAGKTTLFHGILAVLVPKSGEIRFKGQNSTDLSPYIEDRSGEKLSIGVDFSRFAGHIRMRTKKHRVEYGNRSVFSIPSFSSKNA